MAPATVLMVNMPWGTSGNDGLPFFTGRNVSRFLSEYEALCERHQCKVEHRVEGVPRFAAADEQERLRSFLEWEDCDWEGMKKKMRKEYKTKDEEQQMLTSAYMTALSRQKRLRRDDIQLYLRQFRKVALHLISTGAETEYACARQFVHGLPDAFREKIVQKQGLSQEDPKSANFLNCWTQAREL